MRTLAIGIPLPHPTFDNHSLLSAPSFSDCRRIIVDTAAASRTVDAVVAGADAHSTFAGQPVTNGVSSPTAFGLADMLTMRRHEAEWVLCRGGVIVCIAGPDVAVEEVESLPGWRCYDWLPTPEGFDCRRHILPGFGPAGVELAAEHPFSPYIQAFAARLAYRAVPDEENAPRILRLRSRLRPQPGRGRHHLPSEHRSRRRGLSAGPPPLGRRPLHRC